jgi:hypothetical protein
MPRIAALLLLALMLTACASADTQASWWKPGMTRDEFARDEALCRQMATVRSPGAMVAGARIRPSAELDEDAYAICMGAAGYEKVPKDFVPPK